MEYKGGASEGRRQKKLENMRKVQEEENQRKKEQILKESAVQVNNVGERFTIQQDDYASALAKDTIGLVTLQEFEKKKKTLAEKRAAEAASQKASQEASSAKAKRKRESSLKANKSKLSFDLEEVGIPEEEENQEEREGEGEGGGDKEGSPDAQPEAAKKLKMSKNPHVDTSFLPDREREEQEKAERERLAAEWRKMQEAIKKEEIEITFSYWDGSGHRSTTKCRKGDTIAQFLEKAKQQFPELKGVSVDNLLYIKEDLIIPHHYTFYDFIINKVRGKSGPLFHFDVHDDVRLLADARVERDESHAGKVVERRWYERNKHIFPASRWELYTPDKVFATYTISDKKRN